MRISLPPSFPRHLRAQLKQWSCQLRRCPTTQRLRCRDLKKFCSNPAAAENTQELRGNISNGAMRPMSSVWRQCACRKVLMLVMIEWLKDNSVKRHCSPCINLCRSISLSLHNVGVGPIHITERWQHDHCCPRHNGLTQPAMSMLFNAFGRGNCICHSDEVLIMEAWELNPQPGTVFLDSHFWGCFHFSKVSCD